MATPGFAPCPEPEEEAEEGEVGKELGEGRRINRPAGVDGEKAEGEEEFPKVEDGGEPGAGEPGGEAADENGIAADGASVLEGDGDAREEGGEGEEGQDARNVPPSDPSALPPDEEEEDGGEHDDGGFGKEGGQIAEKGEDVGSFFPLPLLAVEFDVGVEGEKEEGEGEGVFQFADPGDGFDGEGVDGKEKPADPSVPQAEAAQPFPKEKGAHEMAGKAGEVVAKGGVSPEVPGDPEEGRFERKVIDLGCVEPDVPEAGKGVESAVFGDLGVVIP